MFTAPLMVCVGRQNHPKNLKVAYYIKECFQCHQSYLSCSILIINFLCSVNTNYRPTLTIH